MIRLIGLAESTKVPTCPRCLSPYVVGLRDTFNTAWACVNCDEKWITPNDDAYAPPGAPPPDALARYDARRIVETFDALFDATDVYDFQQYQREMFGDNE